MNAATDRQGKSGTVSKPAKSIWLIGAELTSVTAAFLFVGMMIFGVI